MRSTRLLAPTKGVGIVGLVGQVAALVALVALTAIPVAPAAADDGSVADTPLGCDGYNAPGSGWTHDQAFGNSTGNKFVPCTRYDAAKRRLEATGRFRGYCRDTTPGARADLYRFCVACRATAHQGDER